VARTKAPTCSMPGATLGATRMDDLAILRTYMNSGEVLRPRSRTVLNGPGQPNGNRRIWLLELGVRRVVAG
jgi:hypothetical protein